MDWDIYTTHEVEKLKNVAELIHWNVRYGAWLGDVLKICTAHFLT